jgi:hypothetical protein
VKIVQEDEKTLLIDHSELNHDPVNNTQYLMDDTLFFRVTMEAADYKALAGVHWRRAHYKDILTMISYSF